jgi:hypothetical protein
LDSKKVNTTSYIQNQIAPLPEQAPQSSKQVKDPKPLLFGKPVTLKKVLLSNKDPTRHIQQGKELSMLHQVVQERAGAITPQLRPHLLCKVPGYADHLPYLPETLYQVYKDKDGRDWVCERG